MDEMVRHTQIWLNETYGEDARYNVIPEDGQTNWTTIYALTRALQIELGIPNTADSFGPTTQALYGQNPLKPALGTSNKYAILQGALWCKGYDPGHYASQTGVNHIDDHFDSSVATAVIALKTDAGMLNPDAIVTTNFMKALLSMDAFKLLGAYGGDANIRMFQQEMNRTYEPYIGIMPCDGIYGRNTNKAFIYALQAEEGLPTSVANGNFGPTTKNCCPQIPYTNVQKSYTGVTYTTSQINQFTKLLNFGLLVNGFRSGVVNSTFSETDVTKFQQHCALPQTGIANLSTWMSLMISTGDDTRIGTACDTRFEITPINLAILKAHNYQFVGRYIIGGSFKEIRDGELERIFNGGLSVFPIYQSSGTSASYFTAKQGRLDGVAAGQAARKHRIPRHTTIYFAVDFDAMDVNVTNQILPYFQQVKACLNGYDVGIYGPRNVCSRVSNAGYATKSFVSDMSTGFSGNLGYMLPSNWAFDQISNKNITHGGNSLEIDNDIASGRDLGFNILGPSDWYQPEPEGQYNFPTSPTNGYAFVNMSGTTIPVYEGIEPSTGPHLVYQVCGDIIGYIKQYDCYTMTEIDESKYVSTRGVIIHSSSGTPLRKGYIETSAGEWAGGTYPWLETQEAYFGWNSNGSSLEKSAKKMVTINGEDEFRVFVTQKELDCYDEAGTPLPTLPRHATIATKTALVGQTHANFMKFRYVFYNNVWTPIKALVEPGSTEGAFVDLGLQYGASPSQRAIW